MSVTHTQIARWFKEGFSVRAIVYKRAHKDRLSVHDFTRGRIDVEHAIRTVLRRQKGRGK